LNPDGTLNAKKSSENICRFSFGRAVEMNRQEHTRS